MTAPDLDYLANLARDAGRLARIAFESMATDHDWKEDDTIVTKTDLAINQMVINRLKTDHPGVSALGEEGSRIVPDSEDGVIFDPVDGTAIFRCKMPGFTFPVAHLHRGHPVSAVVYEPMTDRLWAAERGKGAWFQNRDGQIAARVSGHERLPNSHIAMVFWPGAPYGVQDVIGRLQNLGAKKPPVGSLALAGACVGSGFLDGCICPVQNPWETAATSLIVQEAGGIATDLFGNELDFTPGKLRGHVLSNPSLHEDLLDAIAAVS